MLEGDIAVIKMPQPDGSIKLRPVLLLKQVKPFNDWVVCAISTQLQQEVKGFDLVIMKDNPYFSMTGLRDSSVIRLGMIATVSKSIFPGSIGSLPKTELEILKKRISNHFLH